MSHILLAELQNMILQVKKTEIIASEEISRIERIVEIEKKKDVLKTMISFLKGYMDKRCIYTQEDCNCLNYVYVYGGFVRDWCIPCLNENLDCMEEDSVDVMFERYPNFEIPRDLDVIKRYGFKKETMSKSFTFLKEEVVQGAVSYNNIGMNVLTVKTPLGMTFTIDLSEEYRCVDTKDFDVNQWKFKPCCGIYNNMSRYLSQRMLIKCLNDVKDKRCLFIGKFEATQNRKLISIRQKYIDRIKKMILKGWTITNLSSSISFLHTKDIEDGNCMICQELNTEGDNRVRVSCCSYVLHTECFFDWMRSSMGTKSFARCLTCERTFTPIEQ